ncbi:DNA-directed RNA polymerase subunit 6 [Tupanvirus deep ocean]|uniref:DNA-directed RNA polymerase subunit 6 n=2 Tax=Tupanvirus TaxID=2094720 RepID=A0AC62A966_9VIRU|nr:DNA-directed RNA polymerase subunit 6 [Tupanvirus deep ocean]QKU34295.1 DNA-directed RNA polymerase subunit 6 [Tupanvirus deep ocean]
MEPNKTLFAVIKPDTVKTKIILDNVLTMLGNRIYIDKNGDKQPLLIVEGASKKIEDRGDGTYTIKANNGENFAIKIVFQRISATGKQSIVSEFFKEYAQYRKILIARDFNNKIADYVSKHHTQIFKEATLLSNLIDYRDQPKFELLSPSEMERFKAEYNATDYTTKKMLRSDPVAKYFALRKGDIMRIVRPSPTSGEAIDYRIIM